MIRHLYDLRSDPSVLSLQNARVQPQLCKNDFLKGSVQDSRMAATILAPWRDPCDYVTLPGERDSAVAIKMSNQ